MSQSMCAWTHTFVGSSSVQGLYLCWPIACCVQVALHSHFFPLNSESGACYRILTLIRQAEESAVQLESADFCLPFQIISIA